MYQNERQRTTQNSIEISGLVLTKRSYYSLFDSVGRGFTRENS